MFESVTYKHLQRNSDSAYHDTAVEINVWIELSLDEIGIVQGGLLEPQRDVQQRVANLQRCKQLVALVFDDLCARIIILVNAMAEAHESTPACLALGRFNETRSVVALAVNLFEHFEYRLVCATV